MTRSGRIPVDGTLSSEVRTRKGELGRGGGWATWKYSTMYLPQRDCEAYYYGTVRSLGVDPCWTDELRQLTRLGPSSD